MGIPVDGLTFDPAVAVRGLIVDADKGNLLKADRFGLVKRAMHGSKMLAPLDVQKEYGRDLVQLSNTSRWFFLNTLFSVSEGCLFMQVCPSRPPRCAAAAGRSQAQRAWWPRWWVPCNAPATVTRSEGRPGMPGTCPPALARACMTRVPHACIPDVKAVHGPGGAVEFHQAAHRWYKESAWKSEAVAVSDRRD